MIRDEKNHVGDPCFVEMLRKHATDPVKFPERSWSGFTRFQTETLLNFPYVPFWGHS